MGRGKSKQFMRWKDDQLLINEKKKIISQTVLSASALSVSLSWSMAINSEAWLSINSVKGYNIP